jgi:hypothetical protein
MKRYYVTDKVNKKVVSAVDEPSAAQAFCRLIVKEGQEKLKLIEALEQDPYSPDKMSEGVYSLGEYIYITESGYFNSDMDPSEITVSITVSVLKSIGETELAKEMSQEMDEITSMEKLRGFMDDDQQSQLNDSIDNKHKEKEIDELLE